MSRPSVLLGVCLLGLALLPAAALAAGARAGSPAVSAGAVTRLLGRRIKKKNGSGAREGGRARRERVDRTRARRLRRVRRRGRRHPRQHHKPQRVCRPAGQDPLDVAGRQSAYWLDACGPVRRLRLLGSPRRRRNTESSGPSSTDNVRVAEQRQRRAGRHLGSPGRRRSMTGPICSWRRRPAAIGSLQAGRLPVRSCGARTPVWNRWTVRKRLAAGAEEHGRRTASRGNGHQEHPDEQDAATPRSMTTGPETLSEGSGVTSGPVARAWSCRSTRISVSSGHGRKPESNGNEADAKPHLPLELLGLGQARHRHHPHHGRLRLQDWVNDITRAVRLSSDGRPETNLGSWPCDGNRGRNVEVTIPAGAPAGYFYWI